jgi:Leucine-rich repeat (LRR) protein
LVIFVKIDSDLLECYEYEELKNHLEKGKIIKQLPHSKTLIDSYTYDLIFRLDYLTIFLYKKEAHLIADKMTDVYSGISINSDQLTNTSKLRDMLTLIEGIKTQVPPRRLVSKIDRDGVLTIDNYYGDDKTVLDFATIQYAGTKTNANVKELEVSKTALAQIVEIKNADLLTNLESLKWEDEIEYTRSVLKTFPDKLWTLKNLKHISIVSKKYLITPPEITLLSNLKTLTLVYNDRNEFPKDLAKLKNLTKLIIKNINLEKLPEDIGDLPNLQYLHVDLSSNFRDLPKAIWNLSKLTTLIINANITIPAEIANLKNLIRLEVTSYVPKEIDSLTKLKTLAITNVEELRVPNEITNLINLETLNLNNSDLRKNLPDKLGKLQKLITLDLSDTHLTELPKLSKLQKLKILNLEGTDLGELPDDIAELSSLEILNLKECENITKIPKKILKMPKLKEIKVDDKELLRGSRFYSTGARARAKTQDVEETTSDVEEEASDVEEGENEESED